MANASSSAASSPTRAELLHQPAFAAAFSSSSLSASLSSSSSASFLSSSSSSLPPPIPPPPISPCRKFPKLILLDRDGVINEDVGPPGVLSPSQLELTPNAGTAIGKLRRMARQQKTTDLINDNEEKEQEECCKIVLITNQSCVGKELITESELHDIHKEMQRLLLEQDEDATLDDIFYCTSIREMNDFRMKPNPGMILEACEKYNICLTTSTGDDGDEIIIIGDAIRDLQAAASASSQIRRVLVQTGYGLDVMNGHLAPTPADTTNGNHNNDDKARLALTINEDWCDAQSFNIHKNDQSISDSSSSNSGPSLPSSVLPFHYTANLDNAVHCIL